MQRSLALLALLFGAALTGRAVPARALQAQAVTPPTAAAPADPRARAADSLIQLADWNLREKGDTAQALKLLQRATRLAPNYAPAHYHRGVALLRSTNMGFGDVLTRREAGEEFRRALDLDPGNPRYLLELGRLRLKTPFLRLDAERLFGRALRAAQERNRPQELAEVNYELGQIFERRWQSVFNRRVFSGTQRVVDIAQAADDYRYVRDLFDTYTTALPDAGELDFRKAEEHYRAALAADPGHEPATLALLALLADMERSEEMLKLARTGLQRVPHSARLRMALGLALHRLDRGDEAEAVFDTALVYMDSARRADMTTLERIMKESRAKRLGALSAADRQREDSLFWHLADPLVLTRTNEARVEFLSRVAYADLRFSSPEFSQLGWRTDRGVTWIRYGPPPKVGTFAPENEVAAGGADVMGRITTVWWYPESHLRFVFVGPPAMNYAFFGGDFRAYAENAREIAPVRLDNVAPALRVDTVAVQVARFRGAQDGRVDVSVFADIPTRRMLREVDVSQALLETAMFVGDEDRVTVASARDSSIVRADTRDPVTTRAWRRELPPGDYFYRVEARQPASGRAARGMGALPTAAFPRGTLASSDILVARRIVPKGSLDAIRSRDDMIVVPNASLTFARKDTAHLYWETYGLTKDSTGAARYRVELALHLREIERERIAPIRIIGGLGDVIGLSAEGDDRVLLRYDRSVALDQSDRVPNYLALDLGDAPFGAYTLELTVTDLVSGRKVSQQRSLRIPRP